MIKKNGMCSISFRNLSVKEIIELTKQCSLDTIEWGGDVHVPVGDVENAKMVKELTKNASLLATSYGSYFKAGIDENFKAVSDTAKALGTDVIRVWTGNFEKEAEEFTEEEYLKLVQSVRECADIAKANGQIIAFEYHYLTYCNKASCVLKLINDVDRDNVFTYWQPAYWLGFWGKELSEEQRIEYNLNEIALLKDKIINVHVYAWRGNDRKELSCDKDEWQKYFEKLPDGSAYMEFVLDNSIEQFKKDAKTLISL